MREAIITIYRGSQILVPITVQIENHDHKIFPKINTIYENQMINSLVLSHSHSGNYQTFLNIDENYATGSYYLQLDYDGKKSTPIPFNIIREFEKQKESILGFGDYTKTLYKQKQSHIDLSHKNIDIEFSTKIIQQISGEYDNKGMTGGKLQLFIDGPKSMIHNVALLKTGFFMSDLIVDKEWPTGTYKVSGLHNQTPFATNEFTIKNYNKDSLLKDSPISGTLKLDVTKSNQYSILLINGKLDGQSLPEQIGVRISQDDVTVDVSYLDVKQTGEFETSLVLYDYVKKSTWTRRQHMMLKL